MPSFPQPGTVTICEINRDLITADNLSDDVSKESYGKVIGMLFNPVEFESDSLLLPDRNSNAGDELGGIPEKGFPALIGAVKRIFCPNDMHLLPEVNLQGVSWHQHKHILAFISGPNQVTIRDYDDPEGKEPSILHGDFQREVKVVEWRPNSGRTLSVACRGGVCIWAASYPGNPASVRSGAAPFVGSISKGSGMRWTLVDFLKSHGGEHISALSWSPDGRALAQGTDGFVMVEDIGHCNVFHLARVLPMLNKGSYESSAFTIWDVSQGHGDPIRRGLGGISILRWSPSGDYFFAAKFDGTFYLWETGTWTSQPWSSSSGFVTGASWDPDGHMILLSFSKSCTLGSIHFASKPPSLVAHLLPVELPEIATLTRSQTIEKVAWDASGERLALSFKDGDESYQGLIAIYDVRRTPLIAASLVGFIRGPGDSPKPIAFSFHDKLKQGPLLSVCWSTGFCCTYPLLFRSHILP